MVSIRQKGTMKPDILFIVIGMSVVTYIPRWLPLFLFSRRPMSAWLKEWLDFIPAAILSALIFPAILTGGDPRHIELFKPEFWVAIPTLWVAFMTRSLAGTVITGMGFFWLFSSMLR
jgi:branched-subunit amino acid transport protein